MAIPRERALQERDFNDWMESIEFVDENNFLLPIILTDDISDDPEADRG